VLIQFKLPRAVNLSGHWQKRSVKWPRAKVNLLQKSIYYMYPEGLNVEKFCRSSHTWNGGKIGSGKHRFTSKFNLLHTIELTIEKFDKSAHSLSHIHSLSHTHTHIHTHTHTHTHTHARTHAHTYTRRSAHTWNGGEVVTGMRNGSLCVWNGGTSAKPVKVLESQLYGYFLSLIQ